LNQKIKDPIVRGIIAAHDDIILDSTKRLAALEAHRRERMPKFEPMPADKFIEKYAPRKKGPPLTVRPPKELPAELLPKWKPTSMVASGGTLFFCHTDGLAWFVDSRYADQPALSFRADRSILNGWHHHPNIQETPPMPQTIDIAGTRLPFPPIDATVRGRRLDAFALGTPVVKAYGEGRGGHTPGKVVALCGTPPSSLGLLLSNDYIDLGGVQEPIFYSRADWDDASGKPKGVMVTKTVGELKAGDVFDYKGQKFYHPGGTENMFPYFDRLYSPQILPRDWTVTIIGTITFTEAP